MFANLSVLEKGKILILGFGREGKDTYLFLRKLWPEKILAIADQKELNQFEKKERQLLKKDKKLNLFLGKNYLRVIKNYPIIIKSPGISHLITKPFISKKQIITSQTEIFLQNYPGKIIGITGTKGKGTTASLIYQILKTGGIKVKLACNIGKPVLNLLFSAKPQHVLVYELSSHQLYHLKKSPAIAVLLNIYPEHLDYYKNFENYLLAFKKFVNHLPKNGFLIANKYDKKIFKNFSKKIKN
ncbi:MAG: Mur ligase family protein, partial [Candidatus Woesearchaeota archaeon]